MLKEKEMTENKEIVTTAKKPGSSTSCPADWRAYLTEDGRPPTNRCGRRSST